MRRHDLAAAPLLGLLLSATLPAGLTGQGTPVEPGRTYQGGAAIVSPLTGVSFRLPSGIQAEWEPNLQSLVMAAPDLLGGIWAWSEGTAEEVATEVGRLLGSQGIQLAPRGEIESGPGLLRGDFDAATQEGLGLLHAVVREGPSGGTVAIAALGAANADERLRTFVADVDASLQWSTPGAASWRSQVQGTVLRWTGGGSDISSGSVTATGASQGQATLALCGGGRYRYEESSESYVSIMGASASSTSSDAHAGQWWLVANLAGGATLLLEASDGRYFRWPAEEAGEGFLIDGYRYVLAAGGC